MSKHFARLIAAVMLFAPTIAQADALSALGEAQVMMALLPFVVGGLVMLVVGVRFSITDFQTGRLRKRTAVVMGLSLLLGLLLSLVNRDLSRHGSLFPNLWIDLYVPLAWGLWAAGRARSATAPLPRLRAAALVLAAALAGVGSTVGLYFPEVLASGNPYHRQYSAGLLIGLVALVGTWALGLHQYRGTIAAAGSPLVTKLGWLFGLAPLAGAGYVLLLRLLVDAWHSWSYAASRGYTTAYWSWSTSWPEAAFTLLLYVGTGLGVWFMHWAIHTANPRTSHSGSVDK